MKGSHKVTRAAQPGASYRALLIGIDAYSRCPLSGCVNDIDAIQSILLKGLEVPPSQIERLASPHRGAKHDKTLPQKPATLENIRAAFARLAEASAEGTRVFIYYSGHGMRTKLAFANERAADRESLVPVDFDATSDPRLPYDYELNKLLGDITARTRSVTCILDCCHSAGAARVDGLLARSIDPAELGWPAVLRAPRGLRPPT